MDNEDDLLKALKESKSKQLRTMAFLTTANYDPDKESCEIDGKVIYFIAMTEIINSLLNKGQLERISNTNYRLVE
jgi:hypothetical protein